MSGSRARHQRWSRAFLMAIRGRATAAACETEPSSDQRARQHRDRDCAGAQDHQDPIGRVPMRCDQVAVTVFVSHVNSSDKCAVGFNEPQPAHGAEAVSGDDRATFVPAHDRTVAFGRHPPKSGVDACGPQDSNSSHANRSPHHLAAAANAPVSDQPKNACPVAPAQRVRHAAFGVAATPQSPRPGSLSGNAHVTARMRPWPTRVLSRPCDSAEYRQPSLRQTAATRPQDWAH